MPATYLLLRNNKQSGPHSLEELVQCHLKPFDLIWEEGRSAGWRYPYELEALKPFVNQPESENTSSPRTTEPALFKQPENKATHPIQASHIYVSLPGGITPPPVATDATPESLEAKAEALYQRVQAFSEGNVPDVPDTRFTRSLDDMKDDYGDWLIQQQQKKKRARSRNKLLVGTFILMLITTGFIFIKWVGRDTGLDKNATDNTNLPKASVSKEIETTAATFALVTDSFNTPLKAPALEADTTITTAYHKEPKMSMGLTRTKRTKQKQVFNYKDSLQKQQITPQLPVPDIKPKEETLVKNNVPLSKQVTVNGTLANGKKEVPVILKNNSTETLRSVSVAITYFRKDGRVCGKETVSFQNVPPFGAPVLITDGNRRAATARFEIGTIIRADGSLYLIN